MTNERAGKADCTIWWPMRDQRGRLRPGNAVEWEKFSQSIVMVMQEGRSCLCEYAKYQEISGLWVSPNCKWYCGMTLNLYNAVWC